MFEKLEQKAKQWAEKRLVELITDGSETVTDEHFAARMEVCAGCQFKGKVTPLPRLEMDGCTACGCPFATKARMLMINDAATAAMLNVAATLKDMETKTVVGKPIECPHPSGNLWADVDSFFSQTQTQTHNDESTTDRDWQMPSEGTANGQSVSIQQMRHMR